MAVRFAIQSGNWSNGAIWDGFSALGYPNGEDDVYTNSYTVNMDQSVSVLSLNNSTTPRVVENIATPAMTSNATPSGFVYASGFDPWRAFDQNTSTAWISSINNAGTITYEFPTARNIKRYAIRSTSTAASVPRNWTFEGSNNNIVFTTLDTVSSSLAASSWYVSTVLANTASFTFYRINISSVATAGNAPQVVEIELTESTGSGVGNLSGGSFNFNSGSISASVAVGINAGATDLITVTAATGTVTINAPNATVIVPNIAFSRVINHSGNCDLNFTCLNTVGGIQGSSVSLLKSSTGTLTFTGNITTGTNNACHGLSVSAGNVVYNGNIINAVGAGNSGGHGISQTAGSLTVNGNIITTSAASNAVSNNGINFSGTILTVRGNITPSTGNGAAIVASATTINITGSITGGTLASGLSITSAATVNISGSVAGASAAGITTTQAATLNVTGPITGGSGAVGISSTSTSATNRLTGPFISGPTGIQPFFGPKLTIVTGSATYWSFTAPDLTTNKTLYSTDLVSGVPSPSDVRQGVTYASGALTGTMIVPPTSSVAYGVPVDNTTGSAIIAGSNYNISDQVWNTPVTSLTGSSTIGARLSNSATIASTGAQIAALAGR